MNILLLHLTNRGLGVFIDGQTKTMASQQMPRSGDMFYTEAQGPCR